MIVPLMVPLTVPLTLPWDGRADKSAEDNKSGRPGLMAAFTLAHLSDPRLPPLPVPRASELLGKRALGYLNWTRNRHLYHRRDVLDVLVSDLRTQVPGHIAITGDLVNLALEAEFAPAQAWLKPSGRRTRSRSFRVTMTPMWATATWICRRALPILSGVTRPGGDISVPAAARTVGADQFVDSGADGALHGDRHARGARSSRRLSRCCRGSPATTRSASSSSIIRCARIRASSN